MSISLTFDDKYRLWSLLTQGDTERLCIVTDERPSIGTQVVIQLGIPQQNWHLSISAQVVGRRALSARFPAAIYVRVLQTEIEKCRRFLGLEQDPSRYERGRKAPRIPCDAKVTFTQPFKSEECVARNLSDTGLQTTYTGELVVGAKVALELKLGQELLQLEAEVAWLNAEDRVTGLRFLNLSTHAAKTISSAVDELIRQGTHTGHQIVVADDDPMILALVSRTLTKHGYDVYKATRGEEALTIVRSRKPALVVLDILMPGIDGLEICKIMRADAELSDTPVIFLSALDPGRLHQIADEAGASDYLSKPVALGDLLNLIGGYLKNVSPPSRKAV